MTLLLLGLAAVPAAQSFTFDSVSLVVADGRPAAGRTQADLRRAVALNLHLLSFVAAANRSSFDPGASAMVNLTIGDDGMVAASRMVETTIADTAASGALVRSMLRWRFAPAPGAGQVAFTFRVQYRQSGLSGSAPAAATPAMPVARAVPEAPPVPELQGPRPSSVLTAYDRQRAGTAIGVLGGMCLGTALLAVGSFALGAAFESGDNEQGERVCNVIGCCLAGASGISLVSGGAVGIRLSARARKGSAQAPVPGIELAVEF